MSIRFILALYLFCLFPLYSYANMDAEIAESHIVNSGEVGDVVTSRRLPTITN